MVGILVIIGVIILVFAWMIRIDGFFWTLDESVVRYEEDVVEMATAYYVGDEDGNHYDDDWSLKYSDYKVVCSTQSGTEEEVIVDCNELKNKDNMSVELSGKVTVG